jgi:alkylated DNA repair dioxygenase AlkB
MQTLFQLEPVLPAGFIYYPEFISSREESQLLLEIKEIELHTFHFQGYEAKRKVASFGYDWNFEKQVLSKGREIPPSFGWLIERVASTCSIPQDEIAELLITEYPVGSVINWHRDAPPFDIIAGISLSSDCTFKLRPQEKSKQTRQAVISVPVKRRSLYIMKDEARIQWQHSTSAVKQTRYSITLRTLKKPGR